MEHKKDKLVKNVLLKVARCGTLSALTKYELAIYHKATGYRLVDNSHFKGV